MNGFLPDWLGTLFFIVGIFGGALGVLFSRYRKQAARERQEYVDALKDRNKQLEDTNVRQEGELREVREKQIRIEATLDTMRDFVRGLLSSKCADCEIDPDTGACRYCTRKLLYGQPPVPRSE